MRQGIVIVSFGTTYPGTRHKNIEAITRQARMVYPEAVIAEAVSSTIVRKAMKQRECIDALSTEEALEYMKAQGVTHVAVFPTHILDGIENNRMKENITKYESDFESVKIADALLARDEDYVNTAKAVWESLKDEVGDKTLVFMGHGTEHAADADYERMEKVLREYSHHNIYIATVEGSVTIENVIARMNADNADKCVVLTPFMLVAGDHANNDMAGEEDSFASKLADAGYDAECIIRGMGEYPAVREVYMEHLRRVTEKLFADGSGEAKRNGTLYGIGVGPGNPQLMTLEALNIMKMCDIIILPAVSADECHAYRIVEQVYDDIKNKPLVCMPFPMIKDEKKLEHAHMRIYETIKDYLEHGKNVGMLTIGDPGIYSTYMYMHRRAAADGHNARIISGVPSFCAVAARLGTALGEKNQEIHIIPASYDVKESLQYRGTCVYMKSGRRLKELTDALAEQQSDGRTFEVYAVSDCGMPAEKVYRGLEEVMRAEGYLTTVIVKYAD